MSWIDVVDSAIKIGLGALIGGVFSFATIYLNHRNDRLKDLRAHKIKMVEKAVDLVEVFFNAHSLFVSRVAWILEKGGQETPPRTAALNDALKERDLPLLEAASQARIAASRLRLLGDEESFNELKSTMTLIMNFRNEVMVKDVIPSVADLNSHKENAAKLKSLVQEKIAKLYSSL